MEPRVGRIPCPSCGGTETLGDLSRHAHELRRRIGGRSVAETEPPRQDACLACGTIYDPWVHREADRRRVEIARLRRELAKGA